MAYEIDFNEYICAMRYAIFSYHTDFPQRSNNFLKKKENL